MDADVGLGRALRRLQPHVARRAHPHQVRHRRRVIWRVPQPPALADAVLGTRHPRHSRCAVQRRRRLGAGHRTDEAAATSAESRPPRPSSEGKARDAVGRTGRTTRCAWSAPQCSGSTASAVGFNSDEAVYAGQGVAMFGVGRADEYFSLFRAHPLLLQSIVGASFRIFGESDFTARFIVAMLFGVGSVVLSVPDRTDALWSGRRTRRRSHVRGGALPRDRVATSARRRRRWASSPPSRSCLILRWMYDAGRPAALHRRVRSPLVCAAVLEGGRRPRRCPILLYAIWTRGALAGAQGAPITRWAAAAYVLLGALPFPLTRHDQPVVATRRRSSCGSSAASPQPRSTSGSCRVMSPVRDARADHPDGGGRDHTRRSTAATGPRRHRLRRDLSRVLHRVAHEALSLPVSAHASVVRLRGRRPRDRGPRDRREPSNSSRFTRSPEPSSPRCSRR